MDIILAPKKNLVLDASMLSTFCGCARNADLRFNSNLVPIAGKSNALESGSLVHTNLEYYARNRINGFSRAQSISAGMAAMQEYYHGCKECKQNDINNLEGCERHKEQFLGCHNTPQCPEPWQQNADGECVQLAVVQGESGDVLCLSCAEPFRHIKWATE